MAPTVTNTSGEVSAIPRRPLTSGKVWTKERQGFGPLGLESWYRDALGSMKVKSRAPFWRTAIFSIHVGAGNCSRICAGRGNAAARGVPDDKATEVKEANPTMPQFNKNRLISGTGVLNSGRAVK